MIIDILLTKLWGFPCWVWLLLAGIIPFILGWLLGSTFGGGKKSKIIEEYKEGDEYKALQARLLQYDKEENEYKYKIEQLEKELKECRTNNADHDMQRLMYKAKLQELGLLDELHGGNASAKTAVDAGADTSGAVKLATGAAAAEIDWNTADRSGYGAFFQPDDLQIVEGIGPKVEALLKDNGIGDWSALAAKSPDDLKAILKGAKLHMMDPESWPRQAQLATEGKWDELSEYQRFLDGGSQNRGDFETPAKIDTRAEAAGIVAASSLAAASKNTGIDYAGLFDNDNLKIVEGIGPKVEALLKDNGIADWATLGTKTPEDLRKILGDNGLKMMNPDSWPRQAQLAAEGKWGELVEYQKFLDTGKETTGDFENPSKVEELAFKLLGFNKNPEDLKIVEGIGPKIEGLLKAEGINTWADLAASSVDRIQGILDAAGDSFKLAKPTTWPKQAQLAADGKWGELQDYQDYLDKGVDPASK